MSSYPVILLLFLSMAPACAQNTFTGTETDSIPTLKEINRGPKTALLWSIIPGGGQVYNKAWWKVPIVYGGLLGVVAVADFNQTQFSRIQRAIEARCLGDGNIIIVPNLTCIPKDTEPAFDRINNQSLVNQRSNANKNRQTAYFAILGIYVLQAVEAFTDAHLQDFDIDDDLSFRFAPVATPGTVAAAGLIVPLGSNKKQVAALARLRQLTR